jgi:hypothetical protein
MEGSVTWPMRTKHVAKQAAKSSETRRSAGQAISHVERHRPLPANHEVWSGTELRCREPWSTWCYRRAAG